MELMISGLICEASVASQIYATVLILYEVDWRVFSPRVWTEGPVCLNLPKPSGVTGALRGFLRGWQLEELAKSGAHGRRQCQFCQGPDQSVVEAPTKNQRALRTGLTTSLVPFEQLGYNPLPNMFIRTSPPESEQNPGPVGSLGIDRIFY